MTVSPQTLRDLAAYWKAQGGVNLGIVGDAAHQARPSYHNGQDVITANGWTAAEDYSIRRPLDREPHLTNAAAAIDLGRLDGSLDKLRDFSDWLAKRCLAGEPGTSDVREVIYSPDGKIVLGYKQGIGHLIAGYGDASHLFHTHISFGRDSEQRSKVQLFAPYFEAEDDVPAVQLSGVVPAEGTIVVQGANHSYIRVWDGHFGAVPEGFTKTVCGKARLAANVTSPGGTVIPAGTSCYMVGDALAVLLEKDVEYTPPVEEFVEVGTLFVRKEG